MSLESKLIEFAENYHKMLMRYASEDNAYFKSIVTIAVDGSMKPLLIFGNAHGRVEDGHCTLVLNPRRSLISRLTPSAYSEGLLKKIVSGKCDLMISLWFDHYKKTNRVGVLAKYKSSKSLPVEVNLTDY
jgi:hypothetical protein